MDEKIFGELDKNKNLKASGLHQIHSIGKSKYKTIPEMFIKSCESQKENQSLGYRETLKHSDTDNSIKYKLGKYNWIPYEELFQTAKNFGCGARNICKLKQKSKVVIYSNAKKECFISMNGLLMQNVTVVPCTGLDKEHLPHILNQTKSKVIIIDEKQKDIITKIKGQCKYLRYVIIIPDNNKESQIIDQNSIGLKCYMYEEIIQQGEYSNILSLPSPSNIAFIVYTKSHHHPPVGVKITHQNMIVSIYGIQERVMATPKDTYLSYSPFNKLTDILLQYVAIFNGSNIGYGSYDTLTDHSDHIMKNTKGDTTKLNPTIIQFTQNDLHKLKESITQHIDKSPSYVKKLFHNVYDKKKEYLSKNESLEDYNGGNGILNVIKKWLGSNLRTIIINDGTTSKELQEFFYICFDVNILHGWSRNETCGFSCLSSPDHYKHTSVGPPLIHNYIKIMKGEVCIGGHNITCGYYKNNEETLQKYFIMNNILWYKTGEKGKIHSNGTLEIVNN
jgi:long-chain acyl-CoA synthetase